MLTGPGPCQNTAKLQVLTAMNTAPGAWSHVLAFSFQAPESLFRFSLMARSASVLNLSNIQPAMFFIFSFF